MQQIKPDSSIPATTDPQARFMEKYKLTPSERGVCHWLLAGKSLPEVALILKKATATVKQQTLSIYRKLGVTSRPQLFAKFFSDAAQGKLSH